MVKRLSPRNVSSLASTATSASCRRVVGEIVELAALAAASGRAAVDLEARGAQQQPVQARGRLLAVVAVRAQRTEPLDGVVVGRGQRTDGCGIEHGPGYRPGHATSGSRRQHPSSSPSSGATIRAASTGGQPRLTSAMIACRS